MEKADNCLSNFSVSYEEFLLDQQAGSIEVDDSLTDFSFALIFKSLIEFPVDKKKLPAKSAFNPHLANNCAKGCYNVYQLNSSTLRWSAYEPSEGLRAHDNSSSFQLTLKVSISQKLKFKCMIFCFRLIHAMMEVMNIATSPNLGTQLTLLHLTF